MKKIHQRNLYPYGFARTCRRFPPSTTAACGKKSQCVRSRATRASDAGFFHQHGIPDLRIPPFRSKNSALMSASILAQRLNAAHQPVRLAGRKGVKTMTSQSGRETIADALGIPEFDKKIDQHRRELATITKNAMFKDGYVHSDAFVDILSLLCIEDNPETRAAINAGYLYGRSFEHATATLARLTGREEE